MLSRLDLVNPPIRTYNKVIILDNGHGGIIDGEYVTEGKRSPIWDDGSQLFEGVFNRKVVAGIIQHLEAFGIPYVNLVDTNEDVSLTKRVRDANKIGNSIYISIHANAANYKASGFEVWTSPGETKSDQYATIMAEEFQKEFPDMRLRTDYSDGDVDKEAKFYVLTKTKMPAILTENFFMTNERECREILMTDEGINKIVRFHVEAIKRMV